MPDIFEARYNVPKMLIADDDPAIMRLLADRGVKMGFKVETASNGIRRFQSYRLETQNRILGPKLRVCCVACVGLWHLADIAIALSNICFWTRTLSTRCSPILIYEYTA